MVALTRAPGLGCDMEAACGGNLFTEMRVTFIIQRAMAPAARQSGAAHAPRPVSVEPILRSATLDGARCAGMPSFADCDWHY